MGCVCFDIWLLIYLLELSNARVKLVAIILSFSNVNSKVT